jgi:hypothetical protein
MSRPIKARPTSIKKITGGRDTIKMIRELIFDLGQEPDQIKHESTPNMIRWMVPFEDGKQLEVLVENFAKGAETTIYLGINVCSVPLRGLTDFLVVALEIADGLIGLKISLVGNFLVLSTCLAERDISTETLNYNVKLLRSQELWFREALLKELNWQENSSTSGS